MIQTKQLRDVRLNDEFISSDSLIDTINDLNVRLNNVQIIDTSDLSDIVNVLIIIINKFGGSITSNAIFDVSEGTILFINK